MNFQRRVIRQKLSKKEEVRKGMKPHDINYRAVYAACTVGQGYAGLEKICGMLNLPKPMTNNNFDLISNTFSVGAKEVAEKSMLDAANELRHGSIADVGVSVDGTLQRRGFLSLDGTVAAISMDNGKIIDVEIMQRYCKPCQQHKEKLTPDDFDVWYEGHKQNWVANYEGSAPMMEVVGAKRIFERSIASRKLRYIKYFGDGDSKAYFEVKDTYKPDMVNKYECVGHYQKRLGTRLRKLKKTTKMPQSIERCSYRQTAELFWHGLTCKYWWYSAENG